MTVLWWAPEVAWLSISIACVIGASNHAQKAWTELGEQGARKLIMSNSDHHVTARIRWDAVARLEVRHHSQHAHRLSIVHREARPYNPGAGGTWTAEVALVCL